MFFLACIYIFFLSSSCSRILICRQLSNAGVGKPMSNRLWPNRISLIRTWKAVSSGNPAVTLNGIPSRVEREALFGVFSISRCRTSGVEIDLSPAWLLLQGGGYTRPLSLFRQLEFFFFFLFFFIVLWTVRGERDLKKRKE